MNLRQDAGRLVGRIENLAADLRNRISGEDGKPLDADMLRRYRAEVTEMHRVLMHLERTVGHLEDLT